MEWTNKTIGNIAFVTKLAGFEHTKYIQGNCVHEKIDDSFIPLFIGKTVRDGRIDKNFDWYIPKRIADQLPRSFLKRKCLVLPYVGTIGDLAVFDASYDALLGSNIAKIELNPNCGYSEEFIYYYLKSPRGQTVLLKDEQGGIQKNITMEAIRNVLLPNVDEVSQKKIVSVLSALDDKIALNKKMNQKLERMAKRLYDYWFVQYDFPDTNGRPYKTTDGKMEYNPTLKREIPEGWTDGVLSDIANITMGQSPDGSSYNEDGEGMIFYQGCTDFGMRFPTARQYTTAPTRFAKKGDILMSVRAPVGAVNIANTDCCIGRGLSALNSKLGSLSHLYFLIDVFKKTFENKNTVGTTFGSITKDELYALPVVIPDKNVIEQFEKMAKPIFDRQMKLGEESNRLTALRDKLLPLLMNGQVEIRDVL